MTRIKDFQVDLEASSCNCADGRGVTRKLKAQRVPHVKKNKVQTAKSRTMCMEEKTNNVEYGRHKEGNAGWADAMQKILQIKKPKRKKTIVLSKAKKLCNIKKLENEENLPFEIDKVKDEIKTQKGEEKREDEKIQLLQKTKDALSIRIKPSIMDRDRERTLQKIATKGVVQLFNAVKQQQGEIHRKLSEAGPLERKREQVLKSIDKSTFLDVLMGGSKSISIDNTIKKEGNKKCEENDDKKTWNVLREDFVMGTKLKDWNCKEEDEDSSAPEDMDSDD